MARIVTTASINVQFAAILTVSEYPRRFFKKHLTFFSPPPRCTQSARGSIVTEYYITFAQCNRIKMDNGALNEHGFRRKLKALAMAIIFAASAVTAFGFGHFFYFVVTMRTRTEITGQISLRSTAERIKFVTLVPGVLMSKYAI